VPAKYSLLSARHIPPTGGNTEFADMRAAYDALDEKTKKEVHDLICLHSQIFFARHPGLHGFHRCRAREMGAGAPAPGAPPSLLRPAVALSRQPSGGIEGWPVPEARAFLRDLTEHATQRKFVYAHVWRPYDLVMWDNRVTMHRARRYDHAEVRDMRRTTLTNEVSSLEQAPPPPRSLAQCACSFWAPATPSAAAAASTPASTLERAAHGNVLIDCGATSMVAIRKSKSIPNGISTVLVSHLHGDHFGGLPFFLLDAQLISRRTAPLLFAGPPGLRERLMIRHGGDVRRLDQDPAKNLRWRSASSSCTSGPS